MCTNVPCGSACTYVCTYVDTYITQTVCMYMCVCVCVRMHACSSIAAAQPGLVSSLLLEV